MSKKVARDRTKFLAKLVTENRKPCVFCQREVDDEVTYGKLYSIGDIQCHYFCVLLSSCLVQKGKDEEGLFGFLYPDILAEVERSKKHKCSFCNKDGATLGCCVSQCRKQFHLPCGRERDAVSLFYGNYKSFCKNHAPKQKVTDNVMAKVRLRMQANKKSAKTVIKAEIVDDDSLKSETVCLICYEDVECYPTPQTFWPPCCARDAWFHRSCVQRMSLSAGMHYLKCPLCNDRDNFCKAVINQGFYVPDRDAAWELEQNAFAEIYERELRCGLEPCLCPSGRDHDNDTGPWDIKLCLLCGSAGAHARCLAESGCCEPRYVCATCSPAAPDDLDELANNIENVILSEQSRVTTGRRPVMPSRMSLRRTKQRQAYYKNSVTSSRVGLNQHHIQESSNTSSSRQDLNLKPPRRQIAVNRENSNVLKEVENKLFSPVKMIEQGLREQVKKIGVEDNFVLEASVVERVRQKFRKPKPLSEKKKIVDGILNDLMTNMMKEASKVKDPVRTWCSPKKESVQDVQTEIRGQHQKSPLNEKLEVKQELMDNEHTSPREINCIDTESITDTSPSIIQATDIINLESHDKSSLECIKNSKENITFNSNNETHDDSSNSTFELPPEFIGDDSNSSLPIFDTPKKLKTVEIEKDSSMEISENDNRVNIDLVKIENSDVACDFKVPVQDKYAFNFNSIDKSIETSEIDIESFKNQYLNEVDRDFKCNFNHKHNEVTSGGVQLRTAIDFAIDAALGTEKRKCKGRKSKSRKRKMSGIVLKYEEGGKRRKDMQTEVSIKNDSMRVKIRLKKKQFKLKIMQAKTETPKTLKQYVLKYSDGVSKEIIGKPEKDVTPIKRKYVKQEKSPDNLRQTSIHSFFKGKTEK